MAIAKAKTVPPKPVELLGVDLQLTHDEAVALADVLGAVGGSPNGSRRRFIDSIYNALRGVGYSYECTYTDQSNPRWGHSFRKDYMGQITFNGKS